MPPARFGRKTTSPASTRWASAAKRWPLSPAWPASKCLPAPRPTSALPSTVSRAGKSSPSSRVREASAPPSGSVTSFQYSCPDEIPQKGFQRGYFRGRHRGPCGPEPPEVSFKFIREGKLQYVTPVTASSAARLMPCWAGSSAVTWWRLITVRVFTGSGAHHPARSCRASRSMQYFYINGRYVRNRTMMAGMEMAFKGTTMQGKFPGGILLLEMPADLVDVNVHPAKQKSALPGKTTSSTSSTMPSSWH